MRTSLISCVLILGLASTAGAREFRVLKGQQRDIAKFERAVSRSALHPRVKKRVLSTIARAKRSVTQSKADYKRVYTRVNRYGGTLVFQPAWGRAITLEYSASGNSRARNIAVFDRGGRSSVTFRAKLLSDQLTVMFRGRLHGGHANPGKETLRYRLYTQNRQRSTAVTQKLGQSLFRGNGYAGQLRQLVSQLEPMMAGSAPKGLKVTRSFNVRALNQAPPVTVENNPY